MNGGNQVHSIGEVSDMLGVPAPTIRSWERRHGLPLGDRPNAKHRRYSADDIAVLQRMRDEMAAGRGAAEAAKLIAASLTATPAALSQELCAAAHAFQAQAITDILDRSLSLHGLAPTVELVLFPAMRELGHQWAVGAGAIAPEHLATSTTQAWLRKTASALPTVPAEAPVILAGGPNELHTLALDAFAVLLTRAGVHCISLGALTPAASLAEAVRSSGARAVVLSCQFDRNRRSALTALQTVADTPASIYYAGAAFRTPLSRRNLPGHYLGEDLSRAAEELAAPA